MYLKDRITVKKTFFIVLVSKVFSAFQLILFDQVMHQTFWIGWENALTKNYMLKRVTCTRKITGFFSGRLSYLTSLQMKGEIYFEVKIE